jgi:hypothetical protein
MFFYGMMRFGKDAPNLLTTPLRDSNGNGTKRLKMDTFIYHVFVLMSLFNQFNCRNIDSDNLNPLHNICNHLIFVFVWALEIFIQQTMVSKGSDKLSMISALLGTGHLEHWETATAYGLAVSTILVHFIAKKIPNDAFKWTDNLFGLEKLGENDMLSNIYANIENQYTKVRMISERRPASSSVVSVTPDEEDKEDPFAMAQETFEQN